MFTLYVRLQTAIAFPYKTGAAALDYRRANGLPDGLTVPCADGYCGATDRKIELPESIARTLLAPDKSSMLVVVRPEWLLPGEVVLADYYHGYSDRPDRKPEDARLGLAPITLDRALSLLAYAKLQAQIESLESQVKDLQSQVRSLERELEEAREPVEA